MRCEVARKLALSKIFGAIGAIIPCSKARSAVLIAQRLRKQPTSKPLTTVLDERTPARRAIDERGIMAAKPHNVKCTGSIRLRPYELRSG